MAWFRERRLWRQSTSSSAGTLVADQSLAGEVDQRVMSAGEGHVRCGGRGDAVLPSLTLVLECIPRVFFKFSDRLVDRLAPRSTGGQHGMWWGTSWGNPCTASWWHLSLYGRWRVGHTVSIILGRRWSSILKTWPSQRSWYFSSMASMLGISTSYSTVGHPGLWAVEEGAENNSPVEADLRLALQVFVVNLFVDLCIRWDGAAQGSKLLRC